MWSLGLQSCNSLNLRACLRKHDGGGVVMMMMSPVNFEYDDGAAVG